MANVVGTPLNDTLVGTDTDDILLGGNGNDLLDGRLGLDVLDGGFGSDTAIYDFSPGGLNANLETGIVNTLDNATQLDTLINIENLTGSHSDDVITGSITNNILQGGEGDDALSGGVGDDLLFGGAGDDILDGGFGTDTLDGDEGNDTATYRFFTGAMVANLETGVVSFTGNTTRSETLISIENLIGSRGNNALIGSSVNNVLDGDDGDDVISAGLGDDRLLGGNGNDMLDGGLGSDILDGGTGIDTATYDGLDSGIDADLQTGRVTIGDLSQVDVLSNIENLVGGRGNDRISGDANSNLLSGGAGDDLLDGSSGLDTLVGGAGNDTYLLSDADTVIEAANAGTDTVTAWFNYTLGVNLEDLTLVGTADVNATGNDLDNVITGNSGDNRINGKGGNDTLVGMAGADILSGGEGADRFIFNGTNEGSNRILDFSRQQGDKIVITSSVFPSLTAGRTSRGRSATVSRVTRDQFVTASSAQDAQDRLIYRRQTGELFYDANGKGGAAQVRIAVLENKPVLGAADFVIAPAMVGLV